MESNIQKLGNTLAGRMQKTAKAAVPTSLELGVITDNLSLETDSLQTAIPRGDYMIALHLTASSYRTSSESHSHSGGSHSHSGSDHSHGGGDHSHSGGAHSHELPGEFRGIKSGDRVLVAWCGNEPVIISIVVSS